MAKKTSKEEALSRQQAWQKERQDAGWQRLSVFLEPEYVEKAKKASKKYGSLAAAVRHWLDQETN